MDGEIEVSFVRENEAAGEEHPDGKNRTDEEVLCHVHIFDTVKKVGCALKDSSSNCLEKNKIRQMLKSIRHSRAWFQQKGQCIRRRRDAK